MTHDRPVLVLGGTGQAGSGTAGLLRRWYPELPLTVAGRDLARARRVADQLGGATAVTTDLARRDLGLPGGTEYAAVVATVRDEQLRGLQYAQDHGVPYLSISSGLVEISPEVVAAAQRPDAAPILVASHCCAGTVVLAALHLATAFAEVQRVRVGVILDETDVGGPAGAADLERWAVASTAGLVRRDGVFSWVAEADAATKVLSSDGTAVAGQTIGILDVPSLALATGAPDVRLDYAVGPSIGRRRGGAPSIEVRIDLAGTDVAGAPLATSHYLAHPDGQRPLTALGIALGAERLLGLHGDPVRPGLHTPESLVDPAHAADRLHELGATFTPAS